MNFHSTLSIPTYNVTESKHSKNSSITETGNHELSRNGERRTRLNDFGKMQLLSHSSYLKYKEAERER